jgi:hypothetical protein
MLGSQTRAPQRASVGSTEASNGLDESVSHRCRREDVAAERVYASFRPKAKKMGRSATAEAVAPLAFDCIADACRS